MLKSFFVAISSLVAAFPLSAAEKEVSSGGHSTVYSCNVLFPHDSDIVEEQKIRDCIRNIDAKHVSYIHIVATASTDGTAEYNLDLSNRRAMNVSRIMREAFPLLKDLHIFGGGQNPRLGRQARIFIVVQPPQVTEVVQEAPQVIREQEIKYEYRYITQSQKGLQAVAQYGLGDVERYRFHHRFLSLGVRSHRQLFEDQTLKWFYGVHFSQYQSTMKRDFEGFQAELGLTKHGMLSDSPNQGLYVRASSLLGFSTNHEKAAMDLGLRIESGWKKDVFEFGLGYSHAYQVKQLGFVVGFEF